jgi:hypothetical protein
MLAHLLHSLCNLESRHFRQATREIDLNSAADLTPIGVQYYAVGLNAWFQVNTGMETWQDDA